MEHSRTVIVQARVPVEARDWLAEQAWRQRRRSPGAMLRVLVEAAMEGEAEALRGQLAAVKVLAAREVLRARQAKADPGAWGDVLRLCAPAPRARVVEGVERG